MSISLFLLVILSSSFGLSMADHKENSGDKTEAELTACMDKCYEEDFGEKHVCYDNGFSGWRTRCHFNCLSSKYNYKEVECKKGSWHYCWNSECPPEEKVIKKDVKFCYKDHEKSEYKYVFFGSVCEIKCQYSGSYIKDAEYVNCTSFYLELMRSYGS